MNPPDQIPLAIVGMSCRLPGADSPQQYWDLIREGRCAIGELPDDRFQRSLYYDSHKGVRGKSYTSLGAVANWPTCPALSREILGSSDPAHIAFSQVAVEALEDSGMRLHSADPGTMGVYVGHTVGSTWTGSLALATMIEQTASWLADVPSFQSLSDAESKDVIQQIVAGIRRDNSSRQPGGAPYLAANQIAVLASTALRSTGPAMAVNAACASSLMALGVAARALQRNEIDSAIVGGTSFFKPDCLILFSKAQSVSATGSRPFDQDADGLIVGEGCAAITLRRLDDAVRSGNQIHAVIHGVGIASDGKGKSLWAPRKEGQVAAMRRAYGSSLDLSRLGYVEAHATSTQVGDATELSALDEVLRSCEKNSIPVGSVKANIGHTLEVAGVAGLMKAVLAIKHKQIPPAVNVQSLNTKLDWSESPLYVPTALAPWDAPTDPASDRELPRRASVNSFGIGGLNAHVVLDEFVPSASAAVSTRPTPQANHDILHNVSSGDDDPIAVVGVAGMFAGAANFKEFGALVRSGRDAKSVVTIDRWDPQMHWQQGTPIPWKTTAVRGGFIRDYQYDWRTHKVPPKQIAAADPLQFMLLDVVDQAIRDARFVATPDSNARTGVVIGNAFGGDFSVQLQMGLRLPVVRRLLVDRLASLGVSDKRSAQIADDYEHELLARMPALLDETGSYSTSTLASRIAKTFDFMGGSFAVDSGHESSFAALASCIDNLRGRHCDTMVCAAGQRAMDLITFQQLSHSGILAGTQNGSHSGLGGDSMLPGEGAGAVVLKRLSDAKRDGDRIHAVIDRCDLSSGSDLQGLAVDLVRSCHSDQLESVDVARVETSFSGMHSQGVSIEASFEQAYAPQLLARAGVAAVAKQIGNTSGASGVATLLKAIFDLESHTTKTRTDCLSVQLSPEGRSHQAARLIVTNDVAETVSEERDTITSHDIFSQNTSAPVQSEHADDCVLELTGTSYEQGLVHGRSCASQIRNLLRRHADLCGFPKSAPASFEVNAGYPERWFSQQQIDEIRGIAAGAEVAFESVLAHNLRIAGDISAGGCAHAVLATADGKIVHGANEDLPISGSLRGCLHRRAQLRESAAGNRYVTFGIVGQVCGINGMNDRGVAVSSAMLLNHDVALEPHRLHCVLIQRLLEQSQDASSAIEIVREFSPDSAGSWGLWISDASGDPAVYLEYSRISGVSLKRNFRTATNHTVALPASKPPAAHSLARLQRLERLIDERPADSTEVEVLQSALRDRFDGLRGRVPRHATMNTVRRADNQMSVVMLPMTGEIHFTAGPLADDPDRYQKLTIDRKTPAPGKTPASQATPAVGARNVCRRYVLRVVPRSLDPAVSGAVQINGDALILGDNAAADLLARQLIDSGRRAVRLSTNQSAEQLIEQLDAAWQASPLPNLFVLTAIDETGPSLLDQIDWSQRRSRGVLMPYLFTQHWIKLVQSSELLESAAFVTCGLLGGDFGLFNGATRVESGACAGLAKALNVEFGQRCQETFMSKAIDFAPSYTASNIVQRILEEIGARTPEVEIGYSAVNQRRVISVHPQQVGLDACNGQVTTNAAPPPSVQPSGAWIVTGGARGVTAVVAKQVALRFGLKLHLLGSSPVPEIDPSWRGLTEEQRQTLKREVCGAAARRGEKPIDSWLPIEKAIEIDATLCDLAASGVEAVYHQCDVGDRSSLHTVLDCIRRSAGQISGVIHGAGFERSGRFDKKKLIDVDRTIASKVDGAAALMQETSGDPLQAFVAFGSISGRFGSLGQTDYCLANEMLAKLVDRYHSLRSDVPATVFHWPAWGEVGMAVRPETKSLLERFDLKFMPTLEGSNHLINELVAGLPEREVLIADPDCRPVLAAAVQQSMADLSPQLGDNGRPAIDPSRPELPPLIDRVIQQTDLVNTRVACEFDPVRDPFLVQHRLRDRPLLPMVIAIEAMLEAASLLVPPGQQVTGIRDVEAIAGLNFHTDRIRHPEVSASVRSGAVECELTCDFHNRAGRLMRPSVSHFTGSVDFGPQSISPHPVAIPSTDNWRDFEYPQEREEVLYHGPIFRNVNRIELHEKGGWAELTVPAFQPIAGYRPAFGWMLSPGILDSMMFSCGIFRWVYRNRIIAVPTRIDSIRFGRPAVPGERCYQRFDSVRFDDQTDSFDSQLHGEDGSLIYRIEGHQAVVLKTGGLQK